MKYSGFPLHLNLICTIVTTRALNLPTALRDPREVHITRGSDPCQSLILFVSVATGTVGNKKASILFRDISHEISLKIQYIYGATFNPGYFYVARILFRQDRYNTDDVQNKDVCTGRNRARRRIRIHSHGEPRRCHGDKVDRTRH